MRGAPYVLITMSAILTETNLGCIVRVLFLQMTRHVDRNQLFWYFGLLVAAFIRDLMRGAHGTTAFSHHHHEMFLAAHFGQRGGHAQMGPPWHSKSHVRTRIF